MAYIANKPVRFDRDYQIGEMIPEGVIAPGMTRKLMEMGKILHVDLPQNSAEQSEAAPADEDTGVAYICEVCGKACRSHQALAAHIRSHKD